MKFLAGEKYDRLVCVTDSAGEEILFDSTDKHPKETTQTAIHIIVSFGVLAPAVTLFMIFANKAINRKRLAAETSENSLRKSTKMGQKRVYSPQARREAQIPSPSDRASDVL